MRNPDPHRRGLRQSERDHEGDRGELQRDTVGSKLDRTDLAHHQRGGGEQADLRQNRDADRQPKMHHFPQRVPVRPPEADEQLVAARLRACLDIGDHEQEARRLDDHRDDGRADHTEPRQAEMAKHQRIGKHRVHQEHGDRDIEDDPRSADRADEGAKNGEEQGRQKAELHDHHIVGGKRRDLGFLSEHQEDRLGIEEQRRGQEGVADRNPHTHADRPPDGNDVASAKGLRHHRHHGNGETRPEDEDRKEELARQDHSRQRLRAELSDDDHVRGVDAELCELRADQRDAERQRRANVRGPAFGLTA